MNQTRTVTACRTCELVERRDRGDAPPWDQILRTSSWDLVHCYGTSVEGWLVLVCRAHRTALADLTDAEAAELGPLLKHASLALGECLDAVKTYAVQFAEHPQHPHVHVHVIPRAADLPEHARGPRIFDRLGVADGEEVAEPRMNEIAAQIVGYFERTPLLP